MKNGKQRFIPWLVLAAIGVFLIIGHNLALDIMAKVLAVGLIVTALSGVFSWWKNKSKKSESYEESAPRILRIIHIIRKKRTTNM